MQAAPHSPTDVERALEEVYSRRELMPVDESALDAWFGDLLARVGEWLRGLLPSIGFDAGGIQVMGWIVAALFVALAVALLLHLTRSGAAWWSTRDRTAGWDSDSAAASEARTAAEWQARARALAESGRWREAVLALYQALVLGLDARGIVRYDASKTPGDYRRELRADPAMSRLFDTFLRTFEPAAFGMQSADAAVFGRLQALAAEAGARG